MALRMFCEVYCRYNLLTQRQEVLEAVLRAAVALRDRYEAEGWLAAEIEPDWEFKSRHVCLTGCAQLAIIFYRLAVLTGDQSSIGPAERLIAQVAATQNTKNAEPSTTAAWPDPTQFTERLRRSNTPTGQPNSWSTHCWFESNGIKARRLWQTETCGLGDGVLLAFLVA
jgi:hypothetical protein